MRPPLLTFLLAGFLAGNALAQPGDGQGNRPPVGLVDQARAAARSDRNAESAELFRQAFEAVPQRRQELLAEYADQLTYARRAAQAVPLYREALESTPSGDERLRVLTGLGLALLWSDQPSAARPVIEELVRARPQDGDARRNLGRALSWSGRQRESVSYLREYLREHPGDGEARVLMAQAQAWMGRSDEAAATLQAGGADREDGRKLLTEIESWRAPRTRAEMQRSTQSDRLDIRNLRIGHELSFAEGLGTAGVQLEQFDYERQDGSDAAKVLRPMVLGRYRFSDAFELNGQLGLDRIEPRAAPAIDRVVYATWLTWRPKDAWRVDLSTDRSTFDNLPSLATGLTARQHGLSTDYTPSERERYTARLQRGFYSDGNRRWWGQLEGEYRLSTHPEAWIGLRHTRMSFSQVLDNGYFNPREFQATQLTARAVWRPGGAESRWNIQASAALGREHADPGSSKPATDVALRAAYRVDAATRLSLRAQRFSSRTSSVSGFARTTVGLQLERSW